MEPFLVLYSNFAVILLIYVEKRLRLDPNLNFILSTLYVNFSVSLLNIYVSLKFVNSFIGYGLGVLLLIHIYRVRKHARRAVRKIETKIARAFLIFSAHSTHLGPVL